MKNMEKNNKDVKTKNVDNKEKNQKTKENKETKEYKWQNLNYFNKLKVKNYVVTFISIIALYIVFWWTGCGYFWIFGWWKYA